MATILILMPSAAWAYPTQDERSPGVMALQYRKQSNVWASCDASFLDGKVRTIPPDAVRLDRRLEAFLDTGFDVHLGRVAVRFDNKVHYVMRRQAEGDADAAVIDDKVTTLKPSLDLTFVTEKGLEIFVGSTLKYVPAHKQKVDSDVLSSQTKFDRSRLLYNRAGVIRRGGVWAGGFYYSFGKQSARRYEKKAGDATPLTGEDVIFEPARVGMLGEFAAGGILWDFSFDVIQARGKGPVDDAGKTMYSDHLEAHAAGLFELAKPLHLKLGLTHRTLSYANNANITLDTIPVSSVRAQLLLGDGKAHTALGLLYAFGKDGQSLPEFNARYELAAYGLTFGLFYPL